LTAHVADSEACGKRVGTKRFTSGTPHAETCRHRAPRAHDGG
jgi:hypothetical protein